MKFSGSIPDHLTFPFVAKACAMLCDSRTSNFVHANVVKTPFIWDRFVGTAMVDMHMKCGQPGIAREVFDRLPDRDLTTWNAVISGFSKLGSQDEVLHLFHRMRHSAVQPDSITISILSQTAARDQNLKFMRAIHCVSIVLGVKDDVSVSNTLIAAYSKCDDLISSELVFSEIPISSICTISWNSLIAGYGFLGKLSEAITLFHYMNQAGFIPDLSTFLSLLSLCSQKEAISEGKTVHSLSIKFGFDSEVKIVNTLISLYSNCGYLNIARYCFDNTRERTNVTWTSMINGYSKMADIDQAIYLFKAMEVSGEKPDSVTVIAVLSACSKSGALDLGRWINGYVVANGFEENVLVLNALLDMYSKCGSIVEARRVFDSIEGRTVVTWTTMISGFAMNGEFEEALNTFHEMLHSGSEPPNHVTFLAALQACRHGRLLEKGWEIFDTMRRVYRIIPTLEHYSCMVDLLGHGGKLMEALDFIEKMHLEPDSAVWGSLLGSCLVRNETNIGERVAEYLIELEPRDSVSYVSIANIYAAEERWKDMSRIRLLMKQKGAKKSPGISQIHVNGKLNSFRVQDQICLQGSELLEILNFIDLHLREAELDQFLETIFS